VRAAAGCTLCCFSPCSFVRSSFRCLLCRLTMFRFFWDLPRPAIAGSFFRPRPCCRRPCAVPPAPPRAPARAGPSSPPPRSSHKPHSCAPAIDALPPPATPERAHPASVRGAYAHAAGVDVDLRYRSRRGARAYRPLRWPRRLPSPAPAAYGGHAGRPACPPYAERGRPRWRATRAPRARRATSGACDTRGAAAHMWEIVRPTWRVSCRACVCRRSDCASITGSASAKTPWTGQTKNCFHTTQ